MAEGMQTPWGVAQTTHQLAEGVFWVQTPAQGGLIIEEARAKILLSEMALRIGKHWNDFLTFEQEADMMIVFFEHPELYPWAEDELIEKFAEESVRREHPEYFAN